MKGKSVFPQTNFGLGDRRKQMRKHIFLSNIGGGNGDNGWDSGASDEQENGPGDDED